MKPNDSTQYGSFHPGVEELASVTAYNVDVSDDGNGADTGN